MAINPGAFNRPASASVSGLMSAAHYTKLEALMSEAALEASLSAEAASRAAGDSALSASIAALTTAAVPDSSNRRYVTDAQSAALHPAVTVSSPAGWLSLATQALTFALVSASDTVDGVVNGVAQSWAGAKTFLGAVVMAAGLTLNGAVSKQLKITPQATSGTGFANPTVQVEITGTNQTFMAVLGGTGVNDWELAVGFYTAAGAPIISTRAQGLFFNAPSGGWFAPVAPNVVDLGVASNSWRTVNACGLFLRGVTAGSVPLVVQGASGQSTHFIQVNNSGAVALLTLDQLGDLNVIWGNARVGYHLQLNLQGNARPTANAANRGTFYYSKSAGGAADTIQICLKSAGDTYSWVTIATG